MLPARAERPVALPAGFVEGLRKEELTPPALAAHIAVFARDEIVRVLSGPFLAKVGRVVQSAPKSTRIALEALGRETIIALSTKALARV